jgi:hypothetical protein
MFRPGLVAPEGRWGLLVREVPKVLRDLVHQQLQAYLVVHGVALAERDRLEAP